MDLWGDMEERWGLAAGSVNEGDEKPKDGEQVPLVSLSRGLESWNPLSGGLRKWTRTRGC